eukprot:gnl/TRDRNA2_/TRDRNA2_37021_c0_seq2.p1 gnl/TRDRNA2_/TRDRNA2_37021_c0~~gnl/TRDRNA2_/TRDRNA2_37021_c0_seq2.p1  ORF type:complete len:418 (-),score=57.88 gnl/TRDRNA2_/TRDRNA2_37021_c0_seq2:696-1949(-)
MCSIIVVVLLAVVAPGDVAKLEEKMADALFNRVREAGRTSLAYVENTNVEKEVKVDSDHTVRSSRDFVKRTVDALEAEARPSDPQAPSPAVNTSSVPLRFAVGDRVSCSVGKQHWATGTVVKLNYREPDWPAERTVPYQVRLDPGFGGISVFSPADTARCVRSANHSAFDTPSIPDGGGDANGTLKALETELETLRELPFISSVKPIRLMTVAESAGRLFQPTSATGPWVVEAQFRGPKDSAYDSTYVVRAKCNAAWPESPLELRFHNTIYHDSVNQGGLVSPEDLLAAMRRIQKCDEGKKPTPLTDTFLALHDLLLNEQLQPVCACCGRPFEENRYRLNRIEKYATLKKHPELFDAAKGWPKDWFDPSFLAAANKGTPEAWRQLVKVLNSSQGRGMGGVLLPDLHRCLLQDICGRA